MKKYDFETITDRRNTGSEKWNMFSDRGIDVPQGVIPLSVADMEFPLAEPIRESLKGWLDNCVLGYTEPTGEYFDEVIRWMERRHGFSPKREWFVLTPGVVSALFDMVRLYTKKGDKVIINPPVYYPFMLAVKQAGRIVVESPLVPAGNTYNFNFEDFERKCADEKVKLFILCSPHNPVGRVWTEEELINICEICYRYNVFIISDEIHFDLIMPGYRHTSLATFEEKYLLNSAVCTSPSKTFNLAWLQCSNIFIPDENRRRLFNKAKGFFTLNAFAYPVTISAYRHCEDWLTQLINLVNSNKTLVENFFGEKIKKEVVYDLQGTYLQWIDFNFLGMDNKALEKFMNESAYIFPSQGYAFGTGGSGFVRLNLACPGGVIKDALTRLDKALSELKM